MVQYTLILHTVLFADLELDVDVRDRALLYYRMLQLDVHHVERVVNREKSIQKSTFSSMPQSIVSPTTSNFLCYSINIICDCYIFTVTIV